MNCPSCGALLRERVVQEPRNIWSMWHCVECGAYPVTSLLKPATHLYTQEYFEHGSVHTPWYSGYLSYDRHRASVREDFIERLEPYLKDTYFVLDIGCATGTALEAARDLGVSEDRCVGVDVSSYAIDKARKYLPSATFKCKRFEDVELVHQFQMVMIWDVLEHVGQPYAVLQKAVACLTEGGKIVVTTPDPTSKIAQFFGWHWSEFRSGEHLCFISRAWCEWAAQKLGLTVRFMEPPTKHLTIEHAASRLRAYIPFFPRLKSQFLFRARARDQMFVVFEKM